MSDARSLEEEELVIESSFFLSKPGMKGRSGKRAPAGETSKTLHSLAAVGRPSKAPEPDYGISFRT